MFGMRLAVRERDEAWRDQLWPPRLVAVELGVEPLDKCLPDRIKVLVRGCCGRPMNEPEFAKMGPGVVVTRDDGAW